ncbi:hypothetical protein GK047_17865 [Paenibacillus sp. SYP-B3998]|uniref:Uncharacterized protein n=1 Tax=Paenibacillus sp. SYP-B3998 TaxID=2678564 RepID=A0A6G4A0J6_9BACL|nr:hypothetical protein [Paenibacillus sp. SYP-B3998]NEW07870.1 hypothetical protein [Paenibacillus sp. SYP-B3998]
MRSVGFLIIAFSLLTSSLVLVLGQISKSIKMAGTGVVSYGSFFAEIPIVSYFLIIATFLLGVLLISKKD